MDNRNEQSDNVSRDIRVNRELLPLSIVRQTFANLTGDQTLNGEILIVKDKLQFWHCG
jgi:hypothetical protein